MSDAKQIVGVGAGGHARVVIDILMLAGSFVPICLVDKDRSLWGSDVEGVRVIGDDSELPRILDRGVGHAFNGVGSTSDTESRKRVFEMLRDLGFEVPQTVHPGATVATSSLLGAGVVIMANAVVQAGARVGSNVLVNTSAVIEHDCTVGEHAHIATGAILGGGVSVGEGSHIGIGATVRQGVTIGRNAVVGAGAAVIKDVPDGMVVAGVPAMALRTPTL